MCGIFGALSSGGTTHLLSDFKSLAKRCQRRGSDAFGAVSLNSSSKNVYAFKSNRAATAALSSISFSQFADSVENSSAELRGLFGHTRLATNGDQSRFENNQPALGDDWFVAHNGIITNHREIKEKYRLYQGTELDTFAAIAVLEENDTSSTLTERALKLMRELVGANNFICYSRKTGVFLALSTNGSLYYCLSERGLIFASEAEFLKEHGQVIQLKSPAVIYADEGSGGPRVVDLGVDELPTAVAAPETKILVEISDRSLDSRKILSQDHRALGDLMWKSYEDSENRLRNAKKCKTCLLPSYFPRLRLHEDGECNICKNYRKDSLIGNLDDLDRLIGNKPLLVSLSGGRDSCYSLHQMSKLMKKKVVTFTYDWGMVTDLARRNQSRLCGALGVEHVVVSADLQAKRRNIRLNVEAWLKRPALGLVPLFMAGDKQYFYYANKIQNENGLFATVMGENKLEKTGFKSSFAGTEQDSGGGAMAYNVSTSQKMKMLGYYGTEFLLNLRYVNRSIFDTAFAYISYYVIPHNYLNLFNYMHWREKTVEETLAQYDWEYSHDCQTSWRIGDGTAPFYNFIYHTMAGFTENNTLRANQIREGHLDREEALRLIARDNQPRLESFLWYCDIIGVDPAAAARIISSHRPSS